MIKNKEKKEEESKEICNEENKNQEEKKEEINLNIDNLKDINSIIKNNNESNKEENNKMNDVDNQNNEKNNKNSDIKYIDNKDKPDFNTQNDNTKDNINNIIFSPNTLFSNEKFNTLDTNNKNFISNISNINYNDNNNFINNNQTIENNNINNINKYIKQDKTDEKDMINELISKIKSKEIIYKKDNFKETLNKLDEEIKLGLEKLNEINPSQKVYIDIKKELLIKKLSKNKKLSEVLAQINKNIIEVKSKLYLKNDSYIDYKNRKIVKPKVYFETVNKRHLLLNKTFKNSKGYYLSSIDGKLIVNGERKNIITNYDDKLRNFGNKYNTINTKYYDNTFHLNGRRNYSIDKIKKKWDYKDYIPGYKINRPNKFNKDYFNEELDKIDNLLFSKNNFKIVSKLY